ncbi:hypothetical protein E4U41_005955, partial [Claviceps citrina]
RPRHHRHRRHPPALERRGPGRSVQTARRGLYQAEAAPARGCTWQTRRRRRRQRRRSRI